MGLKTTVNGIIQIDSAIQAAINTGDALSVLLAGRAGGQTIYGGIAASENLVLVSTFHATKGTIQIGAASQIFVIPTGQVGINQITKLATLGITGNVSMTGTGTVVTTAGSQTVTGTGTLFTKEFSIGDKITIAGEGIAHYIATITSDTSLTIQRPAGMINSLSGVTFTILKVILQVSDNAGTPRLYIDDAGRLITNLGSGVPDYDTSLAAFNALFVANDTNPFVFANKAGSTVTLRLSNSSTVTSATLDISAVRDNSITSGYNKLSISPSGNSVGAMLTVSGYQRGIGIVASTKLNTLTIQPLASITGLGTVSNSAGGTTVTGVGTQFLLQLGIGDSVTINGETVRVTAIASATSMTVTTITGANSGVAFTFAKAILGLNNAAGSLVLGIDKDGNFILDTTTGNKLGLTAAAKLGIWGATPIVQPTTAIAAATFVANTSANPTFNESTFDGYTIAQIVKALRNIGALA